MSIQLSVGSEAAERIFRTYSSGKYCIIEIIIIFLSINVVNASAQVNISDPAGDFPFPDITQLDVNVTGGELIIEITHVDDVFDPLGLHTSAGIIFMDVDQNHTTGINNTGHGADFIIEYIINRYYNVVNLIDSDGGSVDISSNVNVLNKKIIFNIPLSLLDNDDGKMNILAATKEGIWIGSTFDRVPDYGVLDTGNGLIEVPFPGNKFAGGTIIDPIDSGYPDIIQVNVTVNKGNLDIVVTYKEDLIDYSISYGACAKINLDTDQRLATGFTNTGENPPTFGVDYRINYCVASIMGTPSAYIEGMANSNIGLPFNDGTFRYEGNQIFLSVPLGLLNFDEGNLFLNIFSYNPGTLASLLDIDDIPDYGKGALNTSNGEIQPPVACINNWVPVSDPDNDSIGFGFDGDEITQVQACNAATSIIVKTTLLSFDPDDAAFINIYFDIDQNPNTGLVLSNDANTIGHEYAIASKNDDYGVLRTYMSSLNDYVLIQTDQLAIPAGKQIVMTIPLELIGNDDGAVDMLAQTTTVYPYLVYDIAPNIGIIRLTPGEKTPPASITNLTNVTYASTYINWTWTTPPDPDFSHVMLYLNGTFLKNITAPQNFVNITGLSPDTLYELGTHTVDTSGNINKTWVNAPAKTAPSDSNPPVADCGADKLKCENIASPVQFNASASYDPDGAIISYYWDFGDGTNGTGAAPTHKYSIYRWNGTAYLPFTVNLTVTDNDGLTNSTSQKVVIWIAGDANGDGKVSILDASQVGLRWNSNPADPCADLNNDGKVNILDASIIGLNWGKSA